MNRPTLIDNQGENTLVRGLCRILDLPEAKSEDSSVRPGQVCIATAYFNPSGFAHIADSLHEIPRVRLLLGTDLANGRQKFRKRLDETNGDYHNRSVRESLKQQEKDIEWERDHLPFSHTNGRALKQLIETLRSGNLEVRRYERNFLHAKAYIFSLAGLEKGTRGIIVGSSNLTDAGLTRNLELNLGHFDDAVTAEAEKWFNDLWEMSEPYDLAEVFEVVMMPSSPWNVFVRVLWKLYGEEFEEDIKTDGNLGLTSFQKHGVARALRLIRETGGVIVADEVGLGKTFIAGEILGIYREKRQRALLVCPASIRDSTWKQFLSKYQLFIECLSFEQLAKDIQLKDKTRPDANKRHLQRPLNEYQLVIVDEAHNYRNPDANHRAGALRSLLFGQKRDLLLLTATPVNNSLWDLYHLLRFFVRQDAMFADKGILSMRDKFLQAMRSDPSELSPDVLFPIIDATTVKRTRDFVKKHYEGDNIPGPDGKPQPIKFPNPNAISLRYSLDRQLPGFFGQIEQALGPDGGDPVKFARYTPDHYLYEKPEEENIQAVALIGLLRSGLLKRFESSAFAFRKTLEKIIEQSEVFLEALDSGYVVTTNFMREVSSHDMSALDDLLLSTPNKNDASFYDVVKLRADVEHDQDILKNLTERAASITQNQDSKLAVLANALTRISSQAEEEAFNAEDESQKRKVLIFSYFEDTVAWIKGYLDQELKKNAGLDNYRDRMVVVSGSGDLSDIDRNSALQGFAPKSMGSPNGQDDDLYDLVISTDVLAEGVNLQQCRNIINYDMPWNPMRLVQRHGRIDRIGSPHDEVYLRTIFPEDRLDDLLNLESRIHGKLAQAAASVGVVPPIEDAAAGTQVFTESREEIERLLDEDSTLYTKGGTAGAAQTGEEYRQTLRKAINNRGGLIKASPWKIGSGMVKGNLRGIFFLAVVGADTDLERPYLRFIAANEDWFPTHDTGSIRRNFGTCLRLIECEEETELWFPEFLGQRVYEFWDIAKGDILQEWLYETDPVNLQPKVRPLNHRIAEFIRGNTVDKTTNERCRKALDILESPWPRREEMMLRKWFENEKLKGADLAHDLINRIIDTGIEPTKPPEPLPNINEADIELYCWMGIEPESTA